MSLYETTLVSERIRTRDNWVMTEAARAISSALSKIMPVEIMWINMQDADSEEYGKAVNPDGDLGYFFARITGTKDGLESLEIMRNVIKDHFDRYAGIQK